MIAFYIILGIFLYLTIGVIIIKLLQHFDALVEDREIFGIFVIFFPIVVLWLSSSALGQKISNVIYSFYKLRMNIRKNNNSKRIKG